MSSVFPSVKTLVMFDDGVWKRVARWLPNWPAVDTVKLFTYDLAIGQESVPDIVTALEDCELSLLRLSELAVSVFEVDEVPRLVSSLVCFNTLKVSFVSVGMFCERSEKRYRPSRRTACFSRTSYLYLIATTAFVFNTPPETEDCHWRRCGSAECTAEKRKLDGFPGRAAGV
jgi:hypothetical protein